MQKKGVFECFIETGDFKKKSQQRRQSWNPRKEGYLNKSIDRYFGVKVKVRPREGQHGAFPSLPLKITDNVNKKLIKIKWRNDEIKIM